ELDWFLERLQKILNVVCRLFLCINLTAVRNNRHVEGVLRVVHSVVNSQALLLIFRELLRQVGDVAVRGGEPGTWTDHAELVGVMETDMPRARPAHREPAENDPTRINWAFVVASGVSKAVQSFEHVLLASPPIGIVPAAVGFELDEVAVLRPIPV